MARHILDNKFIVVFFIILGLIFLHYTTILRPIENLISVALSPFQSLMFSAGDQTSESISNIITKRDLISENNSLKERVNNLEQKIVELKFFIEENNLLIKQNEYLENQGFNFLNARVISMSAQKTPNILIINRGSNDGVQIGMAVVAEDGTLVGRIIKTDNHTSQVILIIDNSSKISTSIAGNSEINGIIEGSYNISLSMNYILKNAEIQKGDLVMTSGFDENIPAGILIGEIDNINNDNTELFKSANISTPINFKNLRIVSVIIN